MAPRPLAKPTAVERTGRGQLTVPLHAGYELPPFCGNGSGNVGVAKGEKNNISWFELGGL